MLPFRPVSARPAWQLHAMSLGFVALTTAFLLFILRDGPPNRMEMSIIVGVLVITPSLLRWQLAWAVLFLFLPWVSWLRRVQTVIDPTAAATESFDVILLLPDVITAIAFAGFMLTRQLRKKDPIAPGERAFTYPLTFFVLLAMVQIFNPVMASVSAGMNGARVFLIYVTLFIVGRALVLLHPAQVRWLIALTAISGAICGGYGIWQYNVGFPEYDLKWAKAGFAAVQVVGDTMRAFSTFSFTSTFSHYMVITAAAAAILPGWKSMSRLLQGIAPLLMVLSVGGLAFTFVRSAFIGFAVSIITGIVMAGDRRYRVRRLFMVMGAGCLLVFFSPSNAGDSQSGDSGPTSGGLVAERLMTLKSPTQEGSLKFRTNLWAITFGNALTVCPAGVGLGAGASDRFGGNPAAALHGYTESQYVAELAEMGWAGFILFIWLTIYAILFTLRTYDVTEDEDRRRFLVVSVMWQIGLMVTGVTGGTILYTSPGNAYYWTAIGIAFGVARANEKDRLEARKAANPEIGPYSLPRRG